MNEFEIYSHLIDKKSKLAVIGLGYVGLSVALAFASKISVIGFDNRVRRINELNKKKDATGEWKPEAFENRDIVFTANTESLKSAGFFIIAVPTKVDKHNIPDLSALLGASELVGKTIRAGDYVVFESTTYPGCTEEDCIPLLEKFSGLKRGIDFKVGYSPERINPGDIHHKLADVVKVVSALDAGSLNQIAAVYELVALKGVHKAASIKVAEACKMVENTQRDINVALMNEFSLIFDRVGINTYDVLEAAATKWNFLPFYPGLVGGHCIGVDPYYLTYKAAALGYEARLIASSRYINDEMAKYVARKIITHVLHASENPKVLVKGVTFKENVTDIRNSKIVDTVKELVAFNIRVDIEDPFASEEEVLAEYGLLLTREPGTDYDAVIIAIPHSPYRELTEEDFVAITKPNALIADLKGIYKNKILKRKYWSL